MEAETTKNSIPDELTGRYSDFAVIGEGAMGVVFRAHDSSLDKTVSIKLIKETQMAPAMAVRFQKEARAASKLKHPNLVTILDFGVLDKGEPYIIMDYAHGRSLDSILKQEGVLPLRSAAHITNQILEGMEHAHTHGVVHRDLKPSNVIISGENLDSVSVKILDFGVAQIDEDSTAGSITRTGSILGTPYYMSPEQCAGDEVDRRSDIYAAGTILFRMVTGVLPFQADTMLEMMQEKRSQSAPRMSSLVDSFIPEEIEEVVACCLEIDPKKRYQTMSDFKAALDSAMQSIKENEEQKEQQAKLVSPRKEKKQLDPNAIRLSLIVAGVVLIVCLAITAWVSVRFEKSVKPMVTSAEGRNEQHSQAEMNERYYDRFRIDPKERHWTGVGEITDDDLVWLAETHGSEINQLNLGGEQTLLKQDKITDRGWKAVGSIPLQILSVVGTSITDRHLKYLKSPRLRDLYLTRTKVSDAGMKDLANTNISMLNLTETNVTDKGMEDVGRMKFLDTLTIEDLKVTDKGIAHLGKCKLKFINLSGTKISDDALRVLGKIHSLDSIWFSRTKVSRRGVEALRDLNLVTISAEGCAGIDDDCLSFAINHWPKLVSLNLSDTSITGKSLKKIGQLKELERLNLSSIELNDQDLEPIFSLKKLGWLGLCITNVTDKTAGRLPELKSLRTVDLNHCKGITPQVVQTIRKQIKDVQFLGGRDSEFEDVYSNFMDN